MPLLTMVDLCVRYKSGGDVLSNVSLSIADGESVGLLGESGSGKTTLALAALELLPPTAAVSGRLFFRGREFGPSVRGHGITAIFQEPQAALNPVLRIGTQIAQACRAHGFDHSPAEIDRLLNLAGLGDVKRAWPNELSGGECQRVCIALALACRPQLLIADEPTASLDSIAQARVLDVLAGLIRQRLCSLLLISHDPALLCRITHRVIATSISDWVTHEPGRK